MRVVDVRNVHAALPEGIRQLALFGEQRTSRNGEVLVMPTPTTTRYRWPRERVIFHPDRDANPFFHFIEALWMLAGRNDVGFLMPYVQRMLDYSDDGKTLHGAYGYRWRVYFGFDQLGHVATALRENPEDRRNVVQMWDVGQDLGRDGKDLPCNTHMYFTRASSGALDMTVCCRSNDLIWGAYGANAVHFSMLQEYMAAAIGCEVGEYWQMSNNFHAYVKVFDPLRHLINQTADSFHSPPNPYTDGLVEPYPMVQTPVAQWQQELAMFLDEGIVLGMRDPFFRRVARPIVAAHLAYREGRGPERYGVALEILQQCEATDWRLACEEWIERRYQAFLRASDDGVNYEEQNT